MKSLAMAYLLSSQNPDGGWGYAPRQGSAVEPTSAVLLTLREISACAPASRLAVDWIKSARQADGGWGFNSSDSESAWQTAWAVLALAQGGEAGDFVDRGVQWLLSVKTLQLNEDTMQTSKRGLTVNPLLPGWPWLPGQAPFIEPTALAILALKSILALADNERMHEGLQYISECRCPGGGWNVSNPAMFNSFLPAQAYTTALVLIALRRFAPGSIHSGDIKVLRSEMHRDGGVLALAWGLLALRALEDDDTPAETRLASMQGPNGGWADNPYKTAVALMALRGRL